jgi:hypothetical protein
VVMLNDGDHQERLQVLDDLKWGLHEVLVTSYDALIRRYSELLKGIRWRMVVFDEVG